MKIVVAVKHIASIVKGENCKSNLSILPVFASCRNSIVMTWSRKSSKR